jgi:hypothetical protein
MLICHSSLPSNAGSSSVTVATGPMSPASELERSAITTTPPALTNASRSRWTVVQPILQHQHCWSPPGRAPTSHGDSCTFVLQQQHDQPAGATASLAARVERLGIRLRAHQQQHADGRNHQQQRSETDPAARTTGLGDSPRGHRRTSAVAARTRCSSH